jgi:hypothetical protein
MSSAAANAGTVHPLVRAEKLQVRGHPGSWAGPVSPESKNTSLRSAKTSRCSWIPGLPLRGIPE